MKITLPMVYISNLIMIDINIWHKKKHKFVNMLIACDTGASVTTISNDLLQKLGYDTTDSKLKRIMTASTIDYVKSVCVEKIMIGETNTQTLNDIEIYAHTFPEESYCSGVLGLNFFSQFDSVNFVFIQNVVEFIKK